MNVARNCNKAPKNKKGKVIVARSFRRGILAI
jgi:hypothetical protein